MRGVECEGSWGSEMGGEVVVSVDCIEEWPGESFAGVASDRGGWGLTFYFRY